MVNVEYATFLTEHTGKVAATVSTQSSSESPSAIMVEIILEVSVESMLALTPLPSPSARTMTVSPLCPSTTSTWSPQSSSPTWFTLLYPTSTQRLFIFYRLLQFRERDFRFGNRFAEKRSDFLNDAHLLIYYFIRRFKRLAAYVVFLFFFVFSVRYVS